MRTRHILAAVVAVLLARDAAGQKLASIAGGRSFGGDSAAYTFSFSFNRTEASAAQAGPYLRVFTCFSNAVCGFKPSGEANLGNGTEASANNVLAEISSRIQWPVTGANDHSYILDYLTPSFAADKNFTTRLLYFAPGFRYLYYNYGKLPTWYVMPGVSFHSGWRQLTGKTASGFLHVVPSLETQLTLARWTFGLEGNVYVVRNDEDVVKDGWYGHGSASAAFRFGKYGIEGKYENGFSQPTFTRQNVVTLGLALYK